MPPERQPADLAFHLADWFHGVMFLAEAAAHGGRVMEARQVIAGLEAEATIACARSLHHELSYAQPSPGKRHQGRRRHGNGQQGISGEGSRTGLPSSRRCSWPRSVRG